MIEKLTAEEQLQPPSKNALVAKVPSLTVSIFDILTEADYFTLSHQVNSYLNVSAFVGQYPEYLESMLKHLAFEKLQHCDV